MKFLASKGHNEREIADAIRNHEELKVDEESECCCHRVGGLRVGD